MPRKAKANAMKIQGTVGRSDLEGGYYTLDDGRKTYKLEGGDAALLRAGVRAEVEGDVDQAAFGISFGAPVLRVKRYTIL